MNDRALLDLSNRMKNDMFVATIGSIRSGKSSFINSFFNLMILPNITDEFIKHKIVDELPSSAAGKQIMTVEPKFIPSNSIEMEINDTKLALRFVDCVGEIIPSAEGYGSDEEPRLVKTPWFDEAIPFKEAAAIGTEKVMYNHSNLGLYITSDGTFGEFSRREYEEVENKLIPKLKTMNKPFVIVLNTKNPKAKQALSLASELESKWEVSVITCSAIALTKEDCCLILDKALEEFPISDLEISLPDYLNAIGDDIKLKSDISNAIKETEKKYRKVKDITKMCESFKETNLFSNVELDLLSKAEGKASIVLDLDDSKYKEIVNTLLGDNIETKKDFISYLYQSRKANIVYDEVKNAIEEAKETGYGVSIPRIEDMKLLPPEVVKRNGMYGVKLAASAPCIHMVAVNLEASFTPIIGSYEQSKMLMDTLQENNEEDEIWNKEFFGRKLSNIVNDSMKSKIVSLPDRSKDKIKNVLDRIMNTSRSNLIAIIL